MSLLSVVITVRNRPAYLAECVGALRAQRYPAAAFEIVIVDDASDDGQTAAVVGQLQAQNHCGPRIKAMMLDRRLGPGGARNRGNEVADGDVIVVQDSDDISLPDRLTAIRSFFDANPDRDLFYSGAWAVDREGNVISQHHAYIRHVDELPWHQEIWHPTLAYRKDVLLGTKKGDAVTYPEDPADVDYAFLLAARKNGWRFGCLDVPLVNYRMHPGQISQEQRGEQHRLADINRKKYASGGAGAGADAKRRTLPELKRRGR